MVCHQDIEVSRIRALLYNEQGLIQRDICLKCLKLKPEEIKQKIREQAMLLMEIPLYSFPTLKHLDK